MLESSGKEGKGTRLKSSWEEPAGRMELMTVKCEERGQKNTTAGDLPPSNMQYT